MHLHMVQDMPGKVEFGQRAQALQVGCDIAAACLESQPVPVLQRIVVQVQAGVLGKMGGAQQCPGRRLPAAAVGPAMQGAHQVA